MGLRLGYITQKGHIRRVSHDTNSWHELFWHQHMDVARQQLTMSSTSLIWIFIVRNWEHGTLKIHTCLIWSLCSQCVKQQLLKNIFKGILWLESIHMRTLWTEHPYRTPTHVLHVTPTCGVKTKSPSAASVSSHFHLRTWYKVQEGSDRSSACSTLSSRPPQERGLPLSVCSGGCWGGSRGMVLIKIIHEKFGREPSL